MIDRNPHVKVRTEGGGRPLNNTAALNMQPSEAYGQAASSTARRSNSSSSTESLWHLINIKNIRKMRKRHNPLILLICPEWKNLHLTPDVVNLTSE
jgi:hypothetical protein